MNQLERTDEDLSVRRRALIALAAVSTASRVAFSAAVDVQTAGNAAWLCALLFPAVCLPGLAAFHYASGRSAPHWARVACCAVLFPLFASELSSWLYVLGECVSYTTFTDMPMLYMLLPAIAVSCFAASQGTDACGGLGQAQLAIVPWCFLLSALWQVRDMKPVYLTPILGGGLRAIARGAYLCAGAGLSMPAGLWLVWGAGRDAIAKRERRRAARALPLCALSAAGMLLIYGMLSPDLSGSPRTPTRAAEQLLMGGGSGTSVQFLLMLVWYSLLLLGCVFSCCAAAHALQALFPRLSLRICVWGGALPALALVIVWMRLGSTREIMLAWRCPLATIALALPAFAVWRSERRSRGAR